MTYEEIMGRESPVYLRLDDSHHVMVQQDSTGDGRIVIGCCGSIYASLEMDREMATRLRDALLELFPLEK